MARHRKPTQLSRVATALSGMAGLVLCLLRTRLGSRIAFRYRRSFQCEQCTVAMEVTTTRHRDVRRARQLATDHSLHNPRITSRDLAVRLLTA